MFFITFPYGLIFYGKFLFLSMLFIHFLPNSAQHPGCVLRFGDPDKEMRRDAGPIKYGGARKPLELHEKWEWNATQ
jgi:hypothetical protein